MRLRKMVRKERKKEREVMVVMVMVESSGWR
jgi:hypothetical protein